MSEYRLIPLHGKHGEGKFAKVNPEDYAVLSRFWWRVNTDNGYAEARMKIAGKWCTRKMHRIIMYGPHHSRHDPLIDHKNRVRLDNRRDNLRPATHKQNVLNRSKHKECRSRFTGITWNSQTQFWNAHISVNGKRYHLGQFASEQQAAQVRDACARFHHGDFASTNLEGAECYSVQEATRNNRNSRNLKSTYLGVVHVPSPKRDYWRGEIKVPGRKSKISKRFTDELEAARFYDEMVKMHSLDRHLNFPDYAYPAS